MNIGDVFAYILIASACSFGILALIMVAAMIGAARFSEHAVMNKKLQEASKKVQKLLSF